VPCEHDLNFVNWGKNGGQDARTNTINRLYYVLRPLDKLFDKQSVPWET
jgi:hypothetical protein